MINKYPAPWKIVREVNPIFDQFTGERTERVYYWVKDARDMTVALFMGDDQKFLAELLIAGRAAYEENKSLEDFIDESHERQKSLRKYGE